MEAVWHETGRVTVSVRDLRNHGGEVLDRVARGDSVIITRDGVEVAELHSRPRPGPSARDLIARRRTLPAVDPDRLRADLDSVLDPSL
jgi:prevent-host-death family protein